MKWVNFEHKEYQKYAEPYTLYHKNYTKKSSDDIEIVEIPIIRGIKLIESIHQIISRYDGFISGSYAAYCCSERMTFKEHELPNDLDIFTQNSNSFNEIVKHFSRIGFSLEESTFAFNFKYKNNILESDPDYEFKKFASTKNIQVIKPPVISNSFISKETYAKSVIKSFDITSTSVALINKKKAIAAKNFIIHDKEKIAEFRSMRNKIIFAYRVYKYFSKGYSIKIPAYLNESLANGRNKIENLENIPEWVDDSGAS